MYVVVDKEKLENDLTIVADAIRTKGGTSEKLEFPQGMADAVSGIESGGSDDFVGVKYSEFDNYRGNPRVADARNLPVDRNDSYCGGYPYLFACSSKNPNGGWNTMVEDFYLPDGIHNLYNDMFYYSGSIKNIYGDLTNVGIIYSSCFRYSNIEKFDYYCPNLTRIETNVFSGCQKFITLTLRGNTLVTLVNVSSFTNTPIAKGTGYIYVPSALVDTYKSATNWSTYANQFRALEDYTVDGTITGALDESKI